MTTEQKPNEGDLRVWWIPQVPMEPFHVPVSNPHEAALLLKVLAKYDIWQYEHKVKPDFSNAGGLEVFESGDWSEWDEDGMDIDEWAEARDKGEVAGATGKYPEGKVSPDDEGELNIKVRQWNGLVRLDFGKPVGWLALPAATARAFSAGVLKAALLAEGKKN